LRIEDGCHRRSRERPEEQNRQGKVADEGIQGAGRLTSEDAPSAGQISRQDDPENGRGNIENGLQLLISSDTLRI
jgi:hypothetical protein